MKKFNIINKNGITLKTANTYVNEDINIRLPERDNLKLIPENIKQGVSILGVEGTVIVPEGTYSITANGSYNIANYATANVNVPIPEGYIIPEGQLDITANGTYNVTQYASANVNMLVPEGNYSITANGDYNIAQYSTVNVNVPIPEGYIVAEGQLDITENGVHDVTSFATVNVNVAGSGGEDYLAAKLNGTLREYTNPQVTSLHGYAFYKDTAIRHLDTAATSIAQYSLDSTYINTLILRSNAVATLESVSYTLPYNFEKYGCVFVPDDLVSSYKNATNWSITMYSKIIYPLSKYTEGIIKFTGSEKVKDPYNRVSVYGDTYFSMYSASGSGNRQIIYINFNVPKNSTNNKLYVYAECSDSGANVYTYLDSSSALGGSVQTLSPYKNTKSYTYTNLTPGDHYLNIETTDQDDLYIWLRALE